MAILFCFRLLIGCRFVIVAYKAFIVQGLSLFGAVFVAIVGLLVGAQWSIGVMLDSLREGDGLQRQ